MNKKFTKLMAALALLTFLAVPMGMRGQTTVTYKLTIEASDFNSTSYAANNNEKTSLAVCTTDNTKTYEVNWTSYQVMKNSSNMQWKTNQGKIYNSTDLGTITNVTVTSSAGTFTTYYGTSEQPSYGNAGAGKGYFKTSVGGATGYSSKLEVVFEIEESGSDLEESDLALSNAPVALSFDLYNNTSAQTISYTTSSTGEVTVAESDYITTVVHQTNKTITVTPVAVTNGAKVVTVNQAADDNYAAGSKTFTINITDSTPFTGGDVTFDATVDKDLENISQGEGSITKLGVTFACNNGILGNGTEYRMYKNSTTTFSVSEGTITQIAFTGTSSNPASGFASQTGWTTNGDNGTWTGGAQEVSFTASGAQVRASQIVVTVTMPSTDPSISADDVNLAYNATSGSIVYEIDNYEAGTMVATTTVDWISNFDVEQIDEIGEVSFTVAPNTGAARTASVTLTYTYGDNQTATAEVAVGQAAVPSVTVTPDAVTVAASGDYPEFAISYESLEITSASNFEVVFFDATGTSPTTQPEWITDVEISAGTTGYELILLVDENTGSQRVAYLKIFAMDDNEVEKYSNLVTITQSAAAQTTIDLRGMTTALSFTPGSYSSLTNSYGDYTSVTYTGSNSVEYSGWNLYQVLKSSGNLQMKKDGAGYVEMPTILTDYGFTIIVTAVTNSVDVVLDEESGTNTLTTTETSADVVIQTGSSYAVISTITITPLSAPAEYTLTVSNLSHVNLFVFGGDESEALIEGGGEGTAQVYNGTSVEVSVDVENGYVLESLIVDGNNVTSQIDEITDMYVFTMPDHNVTITATAVLAPATDDYELFSGELVEGDYIIYYDGYAMKNTAVAVGTNRLANESVTPSSSDVISTADANIVWHIAPSGEYWTIYNVAENKYAASTGTKNQAQMLADGTDNKSLWTVTGSSNYEFVNKHNSANSINSHLRNNGTNGWACYSSQTGGVLSLYKKVEPTPATYTKDIVGNTWYFIASPTGSAPTNVDALSDLYYYDEQNHYWRNKKVTANAASLFDFDYGKGYLCANGDNENTPATVTLSFTGDLLSSNTREVNVYYHATTQEGQPNGDNGALAGWNLVGNPFNGNATLNADCFILNGSSINTTAQTAGYVISRFAGVMVKASATGTVLFTKVLEDAVVPQPNQVQIEVAQKVMVRGCASTCVHDNAIVNFNEGSQLEKFVFNPDAAKLYIPQNGKEYAIVSSEANGEMPVCFKAIKDGEYTITVSPEGVDLNYLHLIDNMTGNDVDLLQTPSYTFEASTRDYESRFRLMFAGASTDSATDESFAYFNGSEWKVSNEGEATLQVVDVMGRIISTETINGNFNLNLNQKAGVYMLRLINGENVKVQKVVVR